MSINKSLRHTSRESDWFIWVLSPEWELLVLFLTGRSSPSSGTLICRILYGKTSWMCAPMHKRHCCFGLELPHTRPRLDKPQFHLSMYVGVRLHLPGMVGVQEKCSPLLDKPQFHLSVYVGVRLHLHRILGVHAKCFPRVHQSMAWTILRALVLASWNIWVVTFKKWPLMFYA